MCISSKTYQLNVSTKVYLSRICCQGDISINVLLQNFTYTLKVYSS